MLNMNITVPTVEQTANADLGRVAIPADSEFSLNSLLDGSRTVRSNTLCGTLTIAHQTSKELGGSTRHLVRRDVLKNGDKSPASAQLVIVAQDTAEGRISGRRAVLELIAALLTWQGLSPSDDEHLADVRITSDVLILESQVNNNVELNSLAGVLDRILNGEG